MDENGELAGQGALRRSLLGPLGDEPFELGDLLVGPEAERAQERGHVGIGLIEEVLVEGERTRHLGVEPQRA